MRDIFLVFMRTRVTTVVSNHTTFIFVGAFTTESDAIKYRNGCEVTQCWDWIEECNTTNYDFTDNDVDHLDGWDTFSVRKEPVDVAI